MNEFIVEIPDNIKRQKGGLFSSAGIEGFPVRDEIIRCRDCKHFFADDDRGVCNHFHIGYWDVVEEQDVIARCVVNSDGFCARAEKREV